jgi:predicted lipoprotein with Yx(FWY)xxD motif
MHHSRADHRPHLKIRIALLFAVAAASIGLLSAGAVGSASAQGSVKVAKRSQNKVLGHTVLTNLKGRTLYSLSAEKNGNFICTASDCTALWHPLSVPAGKTPIGPVPLGTVTRPDGSIQVTY